MTRAAYNYTKLNQLRFVFHFNYSSPVSIMIIDALYGSPHRKAHVHKNGSHQRMTKKAHLSMVQLRLIYLLFLHFRNKGKSELKQIIIKKKN